MAVVVYIKQSQKASRTPQAKKRVSEDQIAKCLNANMYILFSFGYAVQWEAGGNQNIHICSASLSLISFA